MSLITRVVPQHVAKCTGCCASLYQLHVLSRVTLSIARAVTWSASHLTSCYPFTTWFLGLVILFDFKMHVRLFWGKIVRAFCTMIPVQFKLKPSIIIWSEIWLNRVAQKLTILPLNPQNKDIINVRMLCWNLIAVFWTLRDRFYKFWPTLYNPNYGDPL